MSEVCSESNEVILILELLKQKGKIKAYSKYGL